MLTHVDMLDYTSFMSIRLGSKARSAWTTRAFAFCPAERSWTLVMLRPHVRRVCAAQQSQLAMAHISPGDAPQVDASLNGSAIHAPQPVRRVTSCNYVVPSVTVLQDA